MEQGTYPWFALQVRPRSEDNVASLLASKGYEICLPVYQCRRQWSDRVKVLEMPLFPGYLFCRLDLNNRLPVLITPGVVQVVGFGKRPAPVDETEMEGIRALMQSGLPARPWPFLQSGSRVRIHSGAMRGVEGILLELRGNYRVVLSVNLLQRSVALEVDSACLSLVDQPAAKPVAAGAFAPSPLTA